MVAINQKSQIMKKKKPKNHWYVTNGGTIRVDVHEMIKDQLVREDLRRMRELLKKYGKKKK